MASIIVARPSTLISPQRRRPARSERRSDDGAVRCTGCIARDSGHHARAGRDRRRGGHCHRHGLVGRLQHAANTGSALVYVADALGGGFWAKMMALSIALSVIATTGTGIVLSARIAYGMASYRALPGVLSTVSRRFATPAVASVVVGVLLIGVLPLGAVGFLGWMFVRAALAVLPDTAGERSAGVARRGRQPPTIAARFCLAVVVIGSAGASTRSALVTVSCSSLPASPRRPTE
jgi:hypothetical protein